MKLSQALMVNLCIVGEVPRMVEFHMLYKLVTSLDMLLIIGG